MNRKLLYPMLGLAVGVVFYACDSQTPLGPDGDEPLFGKMAKVDVCHVTGNGSFHKINISGNALPAHLDHGDAGPSGDPSFPFVTNDGLVLDDNCQVIGYKVSGRLGTADPGTSQNTGQDAFSFTASAGTNLTITVIQDGNLYVEIGLFAPGVPTTGLNLLTGSGGGFVIFPPGSDGSAGPTALSADGTYTVAIEDNFGDFSETAGDYMIVLTADQPIGAPVQVIDEGPETLIDDQ